MIPAELLTPQVHEPEVTEAEERISVATQWQLMWWRFRKHKPALVSAVVVILLYLTAAGAEFLAYADPLASDAQRGLISPQPLHVSLGGLSVNGLTGQRDPQTFKRVYVEDPTVNIPVSVFAQGFPYKLFGLIPMDRHLIGVSGGNRTAETTLFLLGTDQQGRDQFSRLVFATRISLLIGLASVAISLVLGVLLGGLSGYIGGTVDTLIQRLIEILRSIPTIPLWMGLAASVPKDWTIEQVFFAMTLIFSLFSWTELARVVRGRFLSLREEDFVMAAELVGCSRLRIIFRHLVPSFLSHIIAATTLALPAIVIFETSLSFLGLGMRPPAISWGVMLQEASNVQTAAISPWLLWPAVPVIVAILAFNFLGDGLRDAADPYGV
ncbi:MAG: ABC transporter permease [Chloroflexi bacterium]|nr:ABC transporter permease [Chloroflexota bacterium]MBV9132310.1 ABC transporter permease [Chloroflexota bacterium]MBV9899144.1 ABC transporter permease [Chloroflexota bacterium]